jgi:hypothetical protein
VEEKEEEVCEWYCCINCCVDFCISYDNMAFAISDGCVDRVLLA